MRLRHYQQKALDDLRAAFAKKFVAPLCVMPTGAGKTVFFADVGRGAAVKGRVVFVLVHRTELIRQASAKLRAAGVQHGVIAPGRTATTDRVQVASVATLARRLDDPRYPTPDLIILDEAHHATAGLWAKILAHYPRARILGVTATPERLDGRGLGKQSGGPFDVMIVGPSIAELMAEGYLTRTIVFGPPDPPDMRGARSMAGEWATKSLDEIMGQPKIVGNAVEEYRKHADGKPAILFSPSIAHAKAMAEAFRRDGYRSVAVSGDDDPDVRDRSIMGLEDGSVQVLCTCDLISEGLDIPGVACVILMRPTKSLTLYLQQIGRGLRPIWAPGNWPDTIEGRLASIAASVKPHLIVLDLAANWVTHGVPSEDREWTLDGAKKKKEKDPDDIPDKSRQCPKCYAVHEPSPRCLVCGYVYATDAAKRNVDHVGGELSEVTAERIADRAALLAAMSYEDAISQAKTLNDLREVAEARGYKSSWAVKEWAYQQRKRKKAA